MNIAEMVNRRRELLDALSQMEQDIILTCIEEQIPVITVNWRKLERICSHRPVEWKEPRD